MKMELLNKFSAEEVEEIVKLQNEAGKALVEGIKAGLSDDKTPNPVYIPKHLQHRKKGRR